jgi:hypothetical protein
MKSQKSTTTMTRPITNPTINPVSATAPAKSRHPLDWKAFRRCRALIVHLGPQLLAALFDSVELPGPTLQEEGVVPVPVPDRDLLLFVAISVWSRATVDEVVPQPEASAR